MPIKLHISDKSPEEHQQNLTLSKPDVENSSGLKSGINPRIVKKKRSPLRKTTMKFVEEAKAIHKDCYAYDRTVYKNAKTPLKIRCRIHGIFLQNPWDHLRGNGCPQCGIESIKNKQRKTQEQFVKEANQVHQHRYSYEKARYVNLKVPLTIECKIHGPFQQSPASHLNGSGCHQCGIQRIRESRLKDTQYFIERAQKTHQGRYTYDESVYIDSNMPVKIICKIHGPFMQNPVNHAAGQGCPRCGKASTAKLLRKSTEQFIRDARNVHGDRFDYSLVEYHSSHQKVRIICKLHGEFLQAPGMHLQGNGCAHCSGRPFIDKDKFIERAQKIHGDFYDYSKVNYRSNLKKVAIICPRHGLFETTPDSHWKGIGCQLCRKEKDLERRRETFLINARKVHGNRYKYDLSTYIKNNAKMTIFCPIHGPFETTPSIHLCGYHCPQCHIDLVERGYFKTERANPLSF